MKKIRLSVCIISVLLLVSLTAMANDRFIGGYFNYTEAKDEVTIYGYVGDIYGVLEIPSHIGGNPVVMIDYGAFEGCNTITGVIFPNTVKRIEKRAFMNCKSLKKIEFKENSELAVIGQNAFKGCTELTDITIPESIVTIGSTVFTDTAFYNNEDNWSGEVLFIDNCLIKAKEEIHGSYPIPDGTLTVAGSAFVNCRELYGVTFPDGIKAIGPSAFENCSMLKEAILPNSVTIINSKAFVKSAIESIDTGNGITVLYGGVFEGCSELKNVVLHDSLLKIESEAFKGCSALETITIPNSVTRLYEAAFKDCNSLKELSLPFIGDAEYKADYPLGYLFSYDASELNNDRYVPETLEKVTVTCGDYGLPYSFYRCVNIKTIVLPDGPTTLPVGYFEQCNSLETVVLPSTLTEIEREAFWGCISLKSLNIPDSVTVIGRDSFRYCKSLTELKLPADLIEIGESVFMDCVNLKSIHVPSKVERIGESALKNKGLERITVDKNNKYFTSDSSGVLYTKDMKTLLHFPENSPLQSYAVNEKTEVIQKFAFFECYDLKALSVPKGTEMENNCVLYCNNVTFRVYPNSPAHQYAINKAMPFEMIAGDEKPETEFEDMPNDWSTDALRKAVANGLLYGSDNKLLPKDSLTRAQMAAILVRALGTTEIEGLTTEFFFDVSTKAWYYDSMAIAYTMGLFKGDGAGRMNPDDNITRQEAFVVLSRAFALTSSSSSLDGFTDSSDIADWAKDAVGALVSNGYVGGSNGRMNPNANITRAEFAQVMHNLVKTYVNAENDIPTTDVIGNVVVRGNITGLQDITVEGDLIIGEGASSIVLNNVTVKGRVIIRAKGDFVFDGIAEELNLLSENSSVVISSNSKVSSINVTSETSTVKKQ